MNNLEKIRKTEIYKLSKARIKAEIIIYLILKIKEKRELTKSELAKYGFAIMQKGFSTFRLNQIKKAIENESLPTLSIA